MIVALDHDDVETAVANAAQKKVADGQLVHGVTFKSTKEKGENPTVTAEVEFVDALEDEPDE